MSPKISVILPVFNGESYLREAINSVLNQTYTNFELLVINDGSTDSSEKIIKSANDPRINYIKNEINYGLIYSLNKGIMLAKGEYIARMDADDICLPSRFSEQLLYLENHPDIDICGTWAYIIGKNGDRTGRIKNIGNPNLLKVSLFFTCTLVHPSIMGRKSIFQKYMYDPSKKHIEDFALWNTMSRNNIKIANIYKYLLKYRWHNLNISVNNDDIQKEAKLALLKPQISDLLDRDISERELYLHELSFSLYKMRSKVSRDIDSGTLDSEITWFSELANANDRKSMFPRTEFKAFLLSRILVLCVWAKKYRMAFSLPKSFYTPKTLFFATQLIIRK